MQTLTALKQKILVPYQQQKGEIPKTYNELVVSDRGGLVFEPLPGIFQNVAVIDFMSMYPSIIVGYNISPETVGVEEEESVEISEMGIRISPREGLVPAALKGMVEKRIKADQPFWGRRVHAVGAGLWPLHVKSLSVKKLVRAIAETEDESLVTHAQSIGQHIRNEDEDGTGVAVKLIAQYSNSPHRIY